MKKKFMTLALTAAMAASMGMTAFAGQWVQNEDMVGTFRINDENREDYFEFMLGAGDSIAAFYYDTDGDTHIYNFSKVSNTKYRDSSNSRNLTIVDYDTIIVNDRTYIRD